MQQKRGKHSFASDLQFQKYCCCTRNSSNFWVIRTQKYVESLPQGYVFMSCFCRKCYKMFSKCLSVANVFKHYSRLRRSWKHTTVAYAYNGARERRTPLPTQNLRSNKNKFEGRMCGAVCKHWPVWKWRRRWRGGELKPDCIILIPLNITLIIDRHYHKHSNQQCYVYSRLERAVSTPQAHLNLKRYKPTRP